MMPLNDDAVLHYIVCYADTDAGGVVYHARYIEMVERARNRVMNLAGFTFAELSREHDTLLIVHKVNAVYHAPSFLDDHLQLKSRLTACEAARSIWLTEVRRDNVLLAEVSIEMVALHDSTRRLRPHPAILLERLAPFVSIPPAKAARANTARRLSKSA